jgi:hypothetical protein
MSNVPLTREAFEALLLEESTRGMKAVGRALVALRGRQTLDEVTMLTTKYANKVGFSSADARAGVGNAEFFLQRGFLTAGHLAFWRAPDKHGNVRICKYSEQLLEVARQKQAKREERRKAGQAQLSLPL